MKSIDDIADNIETFVRQSSILEMICKHLRIPLAASPLYNFRDALSHYIKLYEATDNEEKIRQEASIDEHLFRGIKDIYVLILNNMKIRISDDLKNSNGTVVTNSLRKLLHKYKNLEIEIRKNSEAGINRDLDSFINELHDLIKGTKKIYEDLHLPFISNANYRLPA